MKNWMRIGIGLALVGSAGAARAGEDEKAERAALAKKVKEAKVPLDQGIAASEAQGKPISAKFEVEDGKLQLSVYTVKDDKFFEVVVDHKTGKVAKTEAITGGEDYADAKAQSEAAAKATTSLGAAVARAVKADAGARAVGAEAKLKDGHPMAEITLLRGGKWKTVMEKLD